MTKNLLKSRDFQEECILSAIEVLSAHFAQWSYHVSFPEVATIPLILLKRLHEQTAIESLHRPIKRLIDQVNTQDPVLSSSVSIPVRSISIYVTLMTSTVYTLHVNCKFPPGLVNVNRFHTDLISCLFFGEMRVEHMIFFCFLFQCFIPYDSLFLMLKLQVNDNKDFIQRKRGGVSFSPNDQASVESFLQVGFPLLL